MSYPFLSSNLKTERNRKEEGGREGGRTEEEEEEEEVKERRAGLCGEKKSMSTGSPTTWEGGREGGREERGELVHGQSRGRKEGGEMEEWRRKSVPAIAPHPRLRR